MSAGPHPTGSHVDVSGPGYDVINNVGSVIVRLGFGADRGFLERDIGQFDEPEEVFAWCGGGPCSCAVRTSKRSASSTSGSSSTTRTPTWPGGDGPKGGGTGTCPTSLIRHIHAASSGEGSPLFQHYVERNRLAHAVEERAAGLLVAEALYRYVRMIATTTRCGRGPAPLPRSAARTSASPRGGCESLGGVLRLAAGDAAGAPGAAAPAGRERRGAGRLDAAPVRVGVYNRHWSTMGGGERFAGGVAEALRVLTTST